MKRVAQLDALRGFSLIGIVLANVMWFSGYAVAPHPDPAWVDGLVTFALRVFVDGKFYALFSLLFGASFWLLVQREHVHGRRPAARIRRRLAALMLIGSAHAVLLWFGDILSLYAVAALPLLALIEGSDRSLLRWAAVLLGAPVVMSAALLLLPEAAFGHGIGYGPQRELSAFASGSYPELLGANFTFLVRRWVLALASGRLPRLLGMFLLGVLIMKRNGGMKTHGRWLLVTTAVASNVLLAVLGTTPVLPPSWGSFAREVVNSVAVPTGCLAYVALLWPALGRGGRVSTALACAGRLSLTHYLSQSLVLGLIFYGCGLGLWGELGAASATLLASAVVTVQVAVSGVWLRRIGVGPAERVLRAL